MCGKFIADQGLKNATILQGKPFNLYTLFNTTDTIYFLMDHDLRIISYNHGATEFANNELGHKIGISEYFLDYFPGSKQPQLLSYMKAALAGRHINYEVSFPQPDGLVNWYDVRLFPISTKDNDVYGLMMTIADISEKRALAQRLEEESSKKQMEITEAVIKAEENERHHIGLELHDNVNQVLTTARLYVGMAKEIEGIKALQVMDQVDNLIQSAISEIRNLSHSLISPLLNEFGLLNSLDYLTGTISKGSRLIITSEIKIDEHVIEDKLKLTIYRIVQEQLTNILKHSKAEKVNLRLKQLSNKILLHIEDNGIGFDSSVNANGVGLMNIKTRASLLNGKVDIISSPGNGCHLLISFGY